MLLRMLPCLGITSRDRVDAESGAELKRMFQDIAAVGSVLVAR